MTESGFERAMAMAIIAGIFIIVLGSMLLLIVFRIYGGVKAGRPLHFWLIAALVAFILTCCMLMYRYS